MPRDARFWPDAPRNVELFAFPDVQLLDVAGPLQVFASANDLVGANGQRPPYRLSIVSFAENRVLTSAGLVIEAPSRPAGGRMNEPVDTKTGLSGHHAPPLFDYGASVRRELEQYASDLDDYVADEPRTFTVAAGDFVLTPRKLLFHCLLHETRHWAQIALAVRRAGLEPPGNHDLFYSKALR